MSPIYPRSHLHCSEPRYYSHKNGETRPQRLALGRVRKFDEDLFSLRVILLCKMTEESHYGTAFSMLPAGKFIVGLIAYKTVIIFRLDVHHSSKLLYIVTKRNCAIKLRVFVGRNRSSALNCFYILIPLTHIV